MIAPKILASGKVVDCFDLKPQDINAWDIAWSLCGSNRYNAATPSKLWSTAAHLALQVRIAMHEVLSPELPGQTALAILLDDAAEAYTFDCPHHLKLLPEMAWFRDLDDKISDVLYRRFALDKSKVDWDLVKRSDKAAATIELKYFWPLFDSATTGNSTPCEYANNWKQVSDAMVSVSARQYVDFLKSFVPGDLIGYDALFEVPDTLRTHIAVKLEGATRVAEGASPV